MCRIANPYAKYALAVSIAMLATSVSQPYMVNVCNLVHPCSKSLSNFFFFKVTK